jgi:hypothetical protein
LDVETALNVIPAKGFNAEQAVDITWQTNYTTQDLTLTWYELTADGGKELRCLLFRKSANRWEK